MKKIEPIVKVEVESFEDVVRLAASWGSLARPIHIDHFKEENKHIYGVLIVLMGYYDLHGVPVFYYYKSDKEINGKYALIKADEMTEKVEISNVVRRGWINIPIVNLKDPTPLFGVS